MEGLRIPYLIRQERRKEERRNHTPYTSRSRSRAHGEPPLRFTGRTAFARFPGLRARAPRARRSLRSESARGPGAKAQGAERGREQRATTVGDQGLDLLQEQESNVAILAQVRAAGSRALDFSHPPSATLMSLEAQSRSLGRPQTSKNERRSNPRRLPRRCRKQNGTMSRSRHRPPARGTTHPRRQKETAARSSHGPTLYGGQAVTHAPVETRDHARALRSRQTIKKAQGRQSSHKALIPAQGQTHP